MENVFKYRENVEEQKKEELAKAINLEYQEEEELDKLYAKRHKALQGNIKNINLMRQQQAYLEAIDNSIQNQQLRVQKAKEVVNEKRANLNEAAVDRKIMQDFKEKCIQKYRQEFLKEEQKLFDELGVIGFNSKAN